MIPVDMAGADSVTKYSLKWVGESNVSSDMLSISYSFHNAAFNNSPNHEIMHPVFILSMTWLRAVFSHAHVDAQSVSSA